MRGPITSYTVMNQILTWNYASGLPAINCELLGKRVIVNTKAKCCKSHSTHVSSGGSTDLGYSPVIQFQT